MASVTERPRSERCSAYLHLQDRSLTIRCDYPAGHDAQQLEREGEIRHYACRGDVKGQCTPGAWTGPLTRTTRT